MNSTAVREARRAVGLLAALGQRCGSRWTIGLESAPHYFHNEQHGKGMDMFWHRRLLDDLFAAARDGRDVISGRNRRNSPVDIAEWLLSKKREIVRQGLFEIAFHVIEREYFDERAERALAANPEWRDRKDELNRISEILGVEVSFLLDVDHATRRRALEVAEFIHEIQAAERRRDSTRDKR